MRYRHGDVPVGRAGDDAQREGHPAPGCCLALAKLRQPAGFEGYDPAAFVFLRDLAAHNEKAWFEANRAAYDEHIKQRTAALVDAVGAELRARDLPLEGDPKRSAFRIHRDVRFSRDKRPYKTEIGSVWYRQGSGKDGAGVLYFHLAPGGCFGAAAFYLPEAETLGAIRERIRVYPDAYRGMCAKLKTAGLSLSGADTLSRMPRGFEDLASSPIASALKFKSFLVRREIPDAVVQSPGLVGVLADLAADSLPLLRFGWAAIDEARTQ